MSTKAFKSQLLAAVAMVLVAVIALGSSTFAWFAMNNKVTATGMSVTTQVSNNLFIAGAAIGDTKKADTAFKTSLVETIGQLLEPVSTVNGTDFFYTKTSNVKATGAVNSAEYVAYTPANTAAFDTNYGTTGAKGYVDYVFQLKAINTEAAAADLKLTKLDLTYGNTDAEEGYEAFRAAVFMDDITAGAAATPTLSTIFAPTGATNFTVVDSVQKAVKTTATLDTVTYNSPSVTQTINPGDTKYYQIVVRLWLEGEDAECSNATFAQLSDKWHFNVGFKLDSTATAVTSLNTAVTASKIDLTDGEVVSVAATAAYTIDSNGYYEITGATLGESTKLYADSNALAYNSRIFIIEDDTYPIDVTNQCTLPAP